MDNEDTEKLPVNFMLIQMREHMLKLLTNKESVCHFCKTSVTNQKCRDLLCSSCVDKHNEIEQFKDHKFVEICHTHPEGILSHICLKCMEVICTLCILAHHSDHEKEVMSCEKGISSLKADIDIWIEETNKKMSLVKSTQHTNQTNMAKTDNLKQKLPIIVSECTEELDQANKILPDLDDHDKNRQEILKNNIGKMKRYQSLLNGLSNIKLTPTNETLKAYKTLKEETQETLNATDLVMEYPVFKVTNVPEKNATTEDGVKFFRSRKEIEKENTEFKKKISMLKDEKSKLEKEFSDYKLKCQCKVKTER